jgi:hypothetical protein
MPAAEQPIGVGSREIVVAKTRGIYREIGCNVRLSCKESLVKSVSDQEPDSIKSRFESYLPSHPVPSLWCPFYAQENPPHSRQLVWQRPVSTAQFSDFSGFGRRDLDASLCSPFGVFHFGLTRIGRDRFDLCRDWFAKSVATASLITCTAQATAGTRSATSAVTATPAAVLVVAPKISSRHASGLARDFV